MFDITAIVLDEASKFLVPDEIEKARIVAALDYWLAFKAHKRQVPDLEKRLEDMKLKIREMVNSISFERDNSTIVIKVGPDQQPTWAMLEFGTLWFAPHPNLVAEVMNAYVT